MDVVWVLFHDRHARAHTHTHTHTHTDVPSLTLNLDPTGGHYVLGPSSQHQVMYTLSVTLHNVKQLPKV